MTTPRLAGLAPILHTPFHDDGSIDVDSFAAQVDFCIASGCDVLVFPSMASEFYTLTDEERMELAEVAISRAGDTPVVIGVTSVIKERAARLAAHAATAGASAVLSMPEFPRTGSLDQTISYFTAVSTAGLPIIFQNPNAGGSSLYGSGQLATLLERVPAIRYIKEEGTPSGQAIGGIVSKLGARLDGVFGGSFGLNQVSDAERGAIGCMPGVGLADRQVEIQHHLDAGDIVAARAKQSEIQPVLDFMRQYPGSSEKLLMHLRGIFATDRVRDPQATALDASATAEFRRLLSEAGIPMSR